jgi:hypothetical protein
MRGTEGARGGIFVDERFEAGPGGVDGGAQPRGSPAYDDDVVNILSGFYSFVDILLYQRKAAILGQYLHAVLIAGYWERPLNEKEPLNPPPLLYFQV